MANGTTTSSFTKLSQRIPPIDYTSRDFESISQDMVRTIPFFAPEWTDHNLSDFGIVLQRLLAFVSDVLHFYIDRGVNEAFLPTAITRRSVINLLKLIDFELRGSVPASVDVEFSIQEALPGDLLIPAGTELQTTTDVTGQPIFFETVEDVVIPAGQLTAVVSAVEGQTKSEDVGVSTGLSRQRFDLVGIPVIDGSLQILIDEGVGEQLWIEVDTFILSEDTDRHFTSQKDENNKATIFFGDNAQGKIPDPGSLIRAVYRVGGGLEGNVPAESITVINRTFTFNAQPVNVEVTNPSNASGGENEMSIDEAKVLGPQSLRALYRAVTEEDYIALSENFPGIAKASVSVGGSPVDPITGCCCCVTVFIAPRGGGPPSTQLKEDLLAYLDERKMVGTCLKIGNPEYAKVDMKGTVFIGSNFATNQLVLSVDEAIAKFFDPVGDFTRFGTPIFLSDLYHLLDAIPGVDHVDLPEVTKQPNPVNEVGSTCTLQDFIVGEESKEEKWTLIFVSPTTFTLRGTVSGLQVNAGTVGVPYSSDKSEISFKVVCTAPPSIGDRIGFTTSKKAANVPMGPNQIAQQGNTQFTFVGGARPLTECP
jgi:hypothetical protein